MEQQRTTIVLHSGDMDKVYSALIIANGALAMGMEASIYFTFWGLQRLQKGGLEKGPLSKMHFLGLGKWMVKQRMKKANVASLERLFQDFKELGGKVIACEMTMEIMGIEDLSLKRNMITILSNKSGRGWEIRLESEKLYYFTINILDEGKKRTLPIPSGKCSMLIDKL